MARSRRREHARAHPVAAGVAIGAMLVAGAAYGATAGATSHHAQHMSARRAGPAAATTLAASFPVLDRSPGADDSLPQRVLKGLAPAIQSVGLAADQSRLALSGNAGDVWLVPGNGTLCMVLQSEGGQAGGMSCSSIAEAESAGLTSLTPNTAVAILPSGSRSISVTHSDGSTTPVAPNSNGAVASTGGATISGMDYTGPDGVAHHLAVHATPPAFPSS